MLSNLVTVFLLLVLPWSKASDHQKHHLYFSFITTKTGSFIASGSIPIVEYALDEINHSNEVLQNYTLHHGEILDSKCEKMASVGSFMQQFFNRSQPTYLALVGCGCSIATLPVAELSYYWNIPHMAFAAAASVLSDKTRFKSFLQVLPPLPYIGSALTSLLIEYGWRQVAVITQKEDVFTGITIEMHRLFNATGLVLEHSVNLVTIQGQIDPNTIFNWDNEADNRIIFINTYSGYTYQILCQAYQNEMFYPAYVWVTFAAFGHKWWYSIADPPCPYEHVERVLNGSLCISPQGHFTIPNDTYTSTSGLTPKEFNKVYKDLLNEPQYRQYSPLSLIGPAYDTIWMIGHGLELALQRIAAGNENGCESIPGELVPLEDFEYANRKMGCILLKSFSDVTFKGITGPFVFDVNKVRPSNIIIFYQYRQINDTLYHVPIIKVTCNEGMNYSKGLVMFLPGESVYSIWGEKGIPYDGHMEKKIRSYNTPMQVVFTLMSSAGIVFAAVCFLFNTIFRKKKVVKLSSPNLNYIVIVGAAILYCDIYCTVYSLTGFDQLANQTVICNLQVWLFSIGYSLCFTVLLAKSWRVYYIFSNPNMKKKAIKDWMLYIIILVLVGIDLLTLIIGTVVPLSRVTAVLSVDLLHPLTTSTNGILETDFVYLCYEGKSIFLLAFSFGYKALLQVVAIFLAFHTRRVKIKALNDFKQIAAIIYINSILLTILAVTAFSLKMYRDVIVSLNASILFIQATVFLGLLFIPSMLALYFDPKGEKIFKDSNTDFSSQRAKSVLTQVSTEGTVKKLQARVKELEMEMGRDSLEDSKVTLPSCAEKESTDTNCNQNVNRNNNIDLTEVELHV